MRFFVPFAIALSGLLLAAAIRMSQVADLRRRAVWDRFGVDPVTCTIEEMCELDFKIGGNEWEMFWKVWRPLTLAEWWPEYYDTPPIED